MEYESDKSLADEDGEDGEGDQETNCGDADRDDCLTIATTALDSTIGEGLARSPEETYAK